MNIQIESITTGPVCRIVFNTNAGRAVAIWQDDSVPIRGNADVEIDIKTALIWGQNCFAAKDTQQWSIHGNLVTLTLCVVRQGADGVFFFDLAGSPTMVEMTGSIPQDVTYILCQDVELNAYPVNL